MLGWIKCIVLTIGSLYFLHWVNLPAAPKKKYIPSRYNARGKAVYRSKVVYNTGLNRR